MFNVPTNAIPYNSVYLVSVTPELATTWLANNNYNRNFDQKEVNKYLRLILENKWKRTHQGIAFDQNGLLIDGQHRLLAIVQANKTIPMLIFTNEPAENHEAIDCGKKRTHLDSMKLELRDSRITAKHISTLRAMVSGRFCVRKNWSNTEINNMYRVYGQAVQFVMDQFASSKMMVDDPTLRGVIARAYYRVPPERLIEFCDILRNGHGEHANARVVLELRSWMLCVDNQRESTRRDIYKRAEYTLLAFMQNSPTVTIPLYANELFPIPE